MIMKKVLSAGLAVLLAFGACSCATVDAEDTDPTGSGTGPKEKPAATETSSYALAEPVLPEMAPYPDEMSFAGADGLFDSDGFDAAWTAWNEGVQARRDAAQSYPGKLDAYLKKTTETFLTPKEAGKNAVCSPVNIWLALAMVAETADGQTRAELLDLLGVSSIEDCRELANKLWTANYIDDGAATSKLAASLWMNQDVPFKEQTVQTLADDYFASTFRGGMTDPAYSAAFKSWLNDNTGGLLQDAVENLPDFDPQTIMALATTVYFSGKWSDQFQDANTYTETFHGAVSDKDADFMHRSSTGQYFYSEHFAAVSLPFEDAGSMWLLLPDEGVTPADLLKSGEAMDFVLSGGAKGAESTFLKIDMAVPKFDVEADMDLAEKLTALGAGSMFTNKADFSNLTDMDGVFIGSATHDARVKVDEEGCEAAAFTAMMECGTAMPPDERVEFKLDRPFLFALMGIDGLPLFYGVVNQL